MFVLWSLHRGEPCSTTREGVLTESRLSLGLVIDIEYDVVTDVEFEQVDQEFDLELAVNGKSISILN
jgi:hypothetical protein